MPPCPSPLPGRRSVHLFGVSKYSGSLRITVRRLTRRYEAHTYVCVWQALTKPKLKSRTTEHSLPVLIFDELEYEPLLLKDHRWPSGNFKIARPSPPATVLSSKQKRDCRWQGPRRGFGRPQMSVIIFWFNLHIRTTVTAGGSQCEAPILPPSEPSLRQRNDRNQSPCYRFPCKPFCIQHILCAELQGSPRADPSFRRCGCGNQAIRKNT